MAVREDGIRFPVWTEHHALGRHAQRHLNWTPPRRQSRNHRLGQKIFAGGVVDRGGRKGTNERLGGVDLAVDLRVPRAQRQSELGKPVKGGARPSYGKTARVILMHIPVRFLDSERNGRHLLAAVVADALGRTEHLRALEDHFDEVLVAVVLGAQQG